MATSAWAQQSFAHHALATFIRPCDFCNKREIYGGIWQTARDFQILKNLIIPAEPLKLVNYFCR